MEYIYNFLDELFKLLNEMSPYLLLGFLFAGILHVYFPAQQIQRYLGGKTAKASLNAALLGVPLPLCSCGVIPTGISFYKNGASKGSAVSFFISTPQTGIDSILVSYSMLGLPFALIRPIIALISGFVGGLFTNALDNSQPNNAQNIVFSNHSSKPKIIRLFNYAFVEFLQDISKWLIIGLLIAAVISVLIPDNFFESYIDNEYLSIAIILAASVPLYVCATGSVPIAAVLMMKGLSPGAAFIFLMAGPATNAATITMIGNVMGKRTLLAYLVSIIGGAVIFGIMINELLPRQWFDISILNNHALHHQNHLLPYWFQIASSVLLIGLIINGYVQKYRTNTHTHSHEQHDVTTTISNITNMKQQTLIVNGMTCNHCKANVERNLIAIDGITHVEANINTNEVYIEGDNIDLNKIQETVTQLGYEYGGKLIQIP